MVVVHLGVGPVDRDLREVRTAESRQLRVEVREQPTVHQRIVGGLDAVDEMADVERDLLGLGEEIGRVAREREAADELHRRQLLRHELGRVEEIDALEHLVVGVGEHLDAELPLRVRTCRDRVGKSLRMYSSSERGPNATTRTGCDGNCWATTSEPPRTIGTTMISANKRTCFPPVARTWPRRRCFLVARFVTEFR
mgnify:CR=1 FL=1